jgi:hypothetical protein
MTEWQPIETAPKNCRVLVKTDAEVYAAHWSKNIFTDDEAWIVAEWGDDGDQALVKPTHWKPLESHAEKLVQEFIEGAGYLKCKT